MLLTRFFCLISLFFSLLSLLQAQEDPVESVSHFEKARTLALAAQYDRANYYFQKALGSFEANEQWESYYLTLVLMSDNYLLAGDYKAAEKNAQEILQNSEKHLGFRNVYQAMAYQACGKIEAKKGAIHRALALYEEAHFIFYQDPEAFKLQRANLYNDFGNAYRDKGSGSLALEYFQRAKRIYEESGKEMNAAISDFNMGSIYVMQEEFAKAVQNFEQALQVFEPQLGPQHPSMASIYNNLGAAYFYWGKYSSAQINYQKALRIKKAALGEKHLEIARAYFNIGISHLEEGKLDLAEKYLSPAATLMKELFDSKHPLLAWIHNHQARLALEKEDFSAALAFCNDSEQANQYIIKGKKYYYNGIRQLENNQVRAQVYQNIFQKVPQPKTLEKGLSYLYQSDSLLQILRHRSTKEEDKIALSKVGRQVYNRALDIQYELYQIQPSPQGFAQLFRLMDNSKAAVLLESMQDASAKEFAGVPEKLLQKEQEIKANLAEYEQKLAAWSAKKDSPEDRSVLEEIIFLSFQTYQLLMEEIADKYPDYYELKFQKQGLSIEQIQEKLSPQQVLINYHQGEEVIYQILISKENLEIQRIQNPNNLLNKYARALNNGIQSQNQSLWQNYSEKLYQLLFPKALAPQFKKLIIIPDDVLNSIPFEVLIGPSTSSPSSSEIPFLIKKYAISYAYSARLFQQSAPKTSKQSYSLLALAPVFGKEANTQSLTLNNRRTLERLEAESKSRNRSSASLLSQENVRPLPATASEVKSIYQQFLDATFPAELYLGRDAQEERLKDVQTSQYDFIHIATHGFINASIPELSGVLLAQDSTRKEDGILFIGELYNLRLNAELVTLSACETALGKIAEGEGVLGLSRALLYAGARNITVSLWKVNDLSTSRLMEDFYRNILKEASGSLDYAQALRAAKLQFIQSKDYAEPYFWSPFILIGN